ncbi:MAG: tetratricopeptide repeat protein [Sphingopyxis sp.]
MGAATAATASGRAGEVGYAAGALGYDALVAGDVRAAEAQIEANRQADANDPARLINLGYIHMQTGRYRSAQALFEAARDSQRHFDVELANGEVADTRTVARRALSRMTHMVASR